MGAVKEGSKEEEQEQWRRRFLLVFFFTLPRRAKGGAVTKLGWAIAPLIDTTDRYLFPLWYEVNAGVLLIWTFSIVILDP